MLSARPAHTAGTLVLTRVGMTRRTLSSACLTIRRVLSSLLAGKTYLVKVRGKNLLMKNSSSMASTANTEWLFRLASTQATAPKSTKWSSTDVRLRAPISAILETTRKCAGSTTTPQSGTVPQRQKATTLKCLASAQWTAILVSVHQCSERKNLERAPPK